MQLEYAGSRESADAAITVMFDELHGGPQCGPVTPQAAALARSSLAVRELRARATTDSRDGTPGERAGSGGDAGGQPTTDPAPSQGRKGIDIMTDAPSFLNEYEMLFPDYTGTRSKVIDAMKFVLNLPKHGEYRTRDAWIETADDGAAQIRLVCKLGGDAREPWCEHEGVLALRENPAYLSDNEEVFNRAYASFYFALPDTLSVEARAEMATHAVAARDLAAEAAAAKHKYATGEPAR